MPRKYGPRVFKPAGINYKSHVALGDSWFLKGTKKDVTHTVTMTPKGFTCDCPGMTYRGKCRHVEQIAEWLEYII